MGSSDQKEYHEASEVQVPAMEPFGQEGQREAGPGQVMALEHTTQEEQNFSQILIIHIHQYRFDPTEDSALSKPSSSGLDKYVKELLERDERTGGRMLQAVRSVSVRGAWYPSDGFSMSDDDITLSKAPKPKSSPQGKEAKKFGDDNSQKIHQVHQTEVSDVAVDAPEDIKEQEKKARIKREGMHGIKMICQILSKTTNMEGFE